MINNKGNNYRKGWKLKVWKKPQRVPHIIQWAEKKGQAGKTPKWEVRVFSGLRSDERNELPDQISVSVAQIKKPKLNPHQRMPWCQFRSAGNWRLSKATVFPTTVAHEGVHFSWRKGREEEHNLRETVKDGVLTIPDLWLFKQLKLKFHVTVKWQVGADVLWEKIKRCFDVFGDQGNQKTK